MNKYVIKRILYSIFCLFVVVMVVMLLVFTAINRSVIFQTDDVWNKKSNNDRTIYEYTMYSKYGYVNYVNYTSFLKDKYSALYGDEYSSNSDFIADRAAIQKKDWQDNESVQEFLKTYGAKGYKLKYLEPVKFKSGKVKPGGTGYLLAVEERHVVLRLIDYIKGFFSIENIHMVKDPELTDRRIYFDKDPYSNFYALYGNGTLHKYLLYVDNRFPYLHQNLFHINLGTSYTTYRGQEITSVITMPTGDLKTMKQQFPADLGTDKYTDTAIDFHSVTYNTAELSDAEKVQFTDRYTVYTYHKSSLSMIERSFIIGIISTLLGYLFGLVLGVVNALNKDRLLDKMGNAYIVFFRSVPSLAYIFIVAAIGTRLFGLPYKYANASIKWLAYIMPIISLTLPQVAGLMMWARRYMIDQMNLDYVKFARSGGLSEGEIYRMHIFRNATIPIVHGIPGAIIGCLSGAIVTERVYSMPGTGNLLVDALNKHDNGVIVAMTVFYTALSIAALLLGDLLMAKVDPRISLSAEKGGGR